MKTRKFFGVFSIVAGICFAAFSQNNKDSLGLPGDNLDLAAVLNIFKQSGTVEEFEKKLNAADTKVNNLDLNHDGQVDYLRVVDYGKKNYHSIVIQDPISSSESQDVATIEVEKKGNKDARIQITGDKDLYGKNYIITPKDESSKDVQSSAKKVVDDDVYASPSRPVVYVNVWGWPCVPFIFGPQYVFWVSPWYWGYYPSWWYPWSPYGWWAYRQNMIGYGFYPYYWRTYSNHMIRAHEVYAPHRVSSTYVHKTNLITHNSGPRYNGSMKSGIQIQRGFGNGTQRFENRSFSNQFKPARNRLMDSPARFNNYPVNNGGWHGGGFNRGFNGGGFGHGGGGGLRR